MNVSPNSKKRADATAAHNENKIATMDAVSRRLHANKKRGKKFYQKGLDTLERHFKYAEFMKFDDAAYLFYKSSISYKICSQWNLAGMSLIKCAEMHAKVKMLPEAAALYTEAAELIMKADVTEAVRTYRLAISIYCDIGRFDIAGRMERSVAFTDYDMHHWEEAAIGQILKLYFIELYSF